MWQDSEPPCKVAQTSFLSNSKAIIRDLGKISINFKNQVFIITGIVIILSIIGISRLEVENSFINYFSKKTEIYKINMKVKQNGLTMIPLDLHFNKKGFIKILLGISKGRKKGDLREYKKQQDWKREKARLEKK